MPVAFDAGGADNFEVTINVREKKRVFWLFYGMRTQILKEACKLGAKCGVKWRWLEKRCGCLIEHVLGVI